MPVVCRFFFFFFFIIPIGYIYIYIYVYYIKSIFPRVPGRSGRVGQLVGVKKKKKKKRKEKKRGKGHGNGCHIPSSSIHPSICSHPFHLSITSGMRLNITSHHINPLFSSFINPTSITHHCPSLSYTGQVWRRVE